VQTEAVKEKAI